jgi:hypothetical protein
MTFSESEVEQDWPALDELKQWRDVTGSEWDGVTDDTRFTRCLLAAIAIVKIDIGLWDELVDMPNAKTAGAAMRMAVLLRDNAEVAPGLLSKDPIYQSYLKGEHRRFPIA